MPSSQRNCLLVGNDLRRERDVAATIRQAEIVTKVVRESQFTVVTVLCPHVILAGVQIAGPRAKDKNL